MKITGKIYLISNEEWKTDKFSIVEAIIETEEQYPQYIPVQCSGSKISLFDQFDVGDFVEVDVDPRGRPYFNEKLQRESAFCSLNAWKVTALSHPGQQPPAPPVQQQARQRTALPAQQQQAQTAPPAQQQTQTRQRSTSNPPAQQQQQQQTAPPAQQGGVRQRTAPAQNVSTMPIDEFQDGGVEDDLPF